jgi:apoptosis-inducing factor 2
MGISVISEEYIDDIPADNWTSDGIKTRSGKHIDGDLVVSTRGGRPNTGFLQGSSLSLTATGHVQVEDTLQAKGISNIFVGGDVIDYDEQKQLAKVCPSATVELVKHTLRMSPV